ncbi:MAG: hypothetical protein ABIY63_12000 [Fibrobacteria bacterium]
MAVCSGSMHRRDVSALIDILADKAKNHPGIRKCLMDFREAQVNLGIMGEYMIGEQAANRLAGLRIAIVHGRGQVDKLLEDTAFNRGLRILMAESLPVALEWLEA